MKTKYCSADEMKHTVGNPDALQIQIKCTRVFVNVVGDVYGRVLVNTIE